MAGPSLRFTPPEQAQKQAEDVAVMAAVLAAKREISRQGLVIPPPPPGAAVGMGVAAPGVGVPPPAPPLGAPPMPPMSMAAPPMAPPPVQTNVPTGGTPGDMALPTALTAPVSPVTQSLFADGGMVPEQQPQAQNALPAELERFVLPATLLFQVVEQARAGQPPRFAEGGMMLDLPLPGQGDGEDETELLRQMSEGLPEPPQAFIAFLERGDTSTEVGADLAQAYRLNPETVPQLWAVVNMLAESEPSSLPPDLLALVGGGKSTSASTEQREVPPLPGQPKEGPMIAKRPQESRKYSARGKRGGPPMPPA